MLVSLKGNLGRVTLQKDGTPSHFIDLEPDWRLMRHSTRFTFFSVDCAKHVLAKRLRDSSMALQMKLLELQLNIESTANEFE